MDCTRSTGFLFWKKPCGHPSIGACGQCRLFICQAHGGLQGDGGLLCHACAHTDDEDSDSDSNVRLSSADGGPAESAADSGGGDAGGGDSGGGDSGGSSSD